MSPTGAIKMITSVWVDGLSIQNRFPNVNFHPVVVLEDILRKADTMRLPEPESCKVDADVYRGGVYTRRRYLQTHVHIFDTHNRNAKKYKCQKCRISYNFESNMQKHMESVHFISPKYKCSVCDMTFKKREYLAEHVTIHTGEKPYKCPYAQCKERFRTRYQKSKHISRMHSNGKSTIGEVDGYGKIFSFDGNLKLHSDKEHGTPKTNYSCYICSEVFDVKMNLVKHIEEEHENGKMGEQPTWKKHTEPQNDQNVVSSQQVADDMAGVKEGILIELDADEQQDINREWVDRVDTSKTRNSIKFNKVPYHDEIGEFNCKICRKKFSHRAPFRQHVRNHRDPNYNRTYENCAKRFRTREQSSLPTRQVQSEGNSFVCGIDGCRQVFTSNSCLKSHEDKDHRMSTPLQSQQPAVALHRTGDDQVDEEIEIKVEELLIESEPNEHQNQQNSYHKLDDRDETIVVENATEPNQMHSNTGSGEFVCKICKKVYTMRCYLEAHIRRIHRPNAKKFKCGTCGMGCRYQQELRIHVETVHHNIRNYKCKTCGKAFKRVDTLREHEKTHIRMKRFKCSYAGCGMRFATHINKSKHERTHSSEKSHICKTDGCDMTFTRKSSLVRHKANVHGISKPKYSCDHCLQMFNLKTKLMKHTKEKHSILEIGSTQQDQVIASGHQEDDNPTGLDIETKVEEVSIESLLNESQNQQDNGHKWDDRNETIVAENATEFTQIRTHTGSEEMVCEICKRKFTNLRSLQAHIRRNHHPNVEKFKCETCGISCMNQNQLRMHVETVHFHIRKYQCKSCGKAFKRADSLSDHERIHKNERPYKCSYEDCDKRFKTRRNKVQHERIHTGERPYVCEIDGCGEEFAYNKTFKAHLQRKHGVSALNFSCAICSELFDNKTQLMKHMKENHPTHTDEL